MKKRKEKAYQQTKYAQALNPFEKLDALLSWSIVELSKQVKK